MSDAVQQIKDRLNIIDVVGGYVELHKAGRHFKGKSPFSSERTPSFYVSPERGMYYCFSTNQGGDIFTFIQAMEGVEFKDALRLLAERAGVELKPESPERRSERDRSYAILATATEFFQDQLGSASAAQQYLEQRDVSTLTQKQWQIGYAPGPPTGGWRELRTHLQEKGFTDAEMLAAGLIKQPDASKEPFDVFRDRVMFPLFDSQGRVVAFSGRLLHPNEKAPKYVNSPETSLYKKSELLYGYDRAKHGLRKLPFWLIAEGQFDVVLAHQAGYTNTIAVSGTALTLQHVQQLERLSTKVVLALDGDRAGIAAMQKAATLMLARGFDVKVAALPEGKDPADLIQANLAAFKQAVKSATTVIEFLLAHIKATSRDERTFKLRVRAELLPYVLLLPSEMEQEHFVTRIAEQTETSRDAIVHELYRLREQPQSEAVVAPTTSDVQTPATTGSEEVYSRQAALFAYLVAAQYIIPKAWGERLQQMIEARAGIDWVEQVAALDSVERERFMFSVEQEIDDLPEKQQAAEVVDRVNQYVSLCTRAALVQSRTKLQEAELLADEQAVTELLATLQRWQNVLAKPQCTVEQLLGDAPLD